MEEGEREKIRVYRVDPSTFVSDRKAILEELMIEADMYDEDVNKMFEELGAEPWCDDPAILDAVINRVAAKLGVIVRYEFPQ
jgi:hypothetical protein